MCILCWNPLSYILLCHNIESPLLRRQNGFGTVGAKRGGGCLGGVWAVGDLQPLLYENLGVGIHRF